MNRTTKRAVTGFAVGLALLGGVARAADTSTTTTTVTTTTTTTTTLLPHPFSKATGTCVRAARVAFKACEGTTCVADVQTAISQCFADPAGVKCAKSCIGKDFTCLDAVPKTKKVCFQACSLGHRRDRRGCRLIPEGDNLWAGGDGACITTAEANLDVCKVVCRQAKLDCQTNFKFCIADCPNL